MVKRRMKDVVPHILYGSIKVTQSTTGTEVFAAPTFKRGRVSVKKNIGEV